MKTFATVDGLIYVIQCPEKPDNSGLSTFHSRLRDDAYNAALQRAIESGVEVEDQLAARIVLEHRDMSYPFTRAEIPDNHIFHGIAVPEGVEVRQIQAFAHDKWNDHSLEYHKPFEKCSPRRTIYRFIQDKVEKEFDHGFYSGPKVEESQEELWKDAMGGGLSEGDINDLMSKYKIERR